MLISLALLLASAIEKQAYTQNYPPQAPGVEWVLVTFDQPPTDVSVEVTPLRYNKDFALSFHADDGIDDVYDVGFQYFTGVNSTHPGLFYSDGAGNQVSFKISSALFSYSASQGVDMHEEDNNFNAVTWGQLEIMYQNGCGIYNHGFTDNSSTQPDFMYYSIKRNESYIRRQLYETTPGGVQTRVFVNPDGAQAYTPVAFDLGYRYVFNQSAQFIDPNDGIDVNSITNWDQSLEMFRAQYEDINMQSVADQLAANSVDGAHYWLPVFTHGLTGFQTTFQNDFSYIAQTYGSQGADNIWMATEEEILNYLITREAVEINHGLAGNNLLVFLDGEVPSDLRFYTLSLAVEAEGAVITDIQVNGGTNNNWSPLNQPQALINLEWDGRHIEPIEELADSYVTIAEATQDEYDCLIAMDYVYMASGTDMYEELRDRLCAIEDIPYDEDFCISCEIDLGDDLEICMGECVELIADPHFEGNTYLWSNDSTSQSITVCPMETTSYWVEVTTAEDCVASDTITIVVLEAAVFDLGGDTLVCTGTTVQYEVEFNPDYTYAWLVNDEPVGNTTHEIELLIEETLTLALEITAPSGCVTTDTVTIEAVELPEVDLGEDFDWCAFDSLMVQVSPWLEDHTYNWFLNGIQTPDSLNYIHFLLEDTTQLVLEIGSPLGCFNADTLMISTLESPVFSLGNDTLVCLLDTLHFELPFGDDHVFEWYVDGILQEGADTNVFALLVTDTLLLQAEVTAPNVCSYSDEIQIFAAELPSITVDPQEAHLCLGESITLTLSATGADDFYWWNDSTAQTITVTPPLAGTHHYWAEALNGYGCAARDTAFVHVYENPMVELQVIQGSPEMCLEESIRLFAVKLNGVNFDKIIWNNGDTLDATTNLNREFFPEEDGWISVEVISASGCTDKDSIFVSVYPLPDIAVSPPQEICQGEMVNLQAEGGSSCAWYVGSALIGEGYTLEVFPEMTTVYTAVVTDTGPAACQASAEVTVTVKPAPELLIEASASLVCPGTEVVLTVSGASTYLWDHGLTGAEIVVKPLETTSYVVTGTDEEGCSTTDSIMIETYPYTEVQLTGLVPVYCMNDASVPLAGIPENGVFGGPGVLNSLFNPEMAGDGTHTITYSITDEFGCQLTDSVQVTVFGGITAIDLGASDTLICPEDVITLDAGPGFNAYYWSTGDTGRFVNVFGMDQVEGATRTISVVGELDGCTASGNIRVTLRDDCYIQLDELDAEADFRLYPNPNQGNFVLEVNHEEDDIQLKLFDSRGQLQFQGQYSHCTAVSPCHIQLPDLGKGVYVLQLRIGKKQLLQKMVVM